MRVFSRLGSPLWRYGASTRRRAWLTVSVTVGVLLLAYRQGRYPSPRFLSLLIALHGLVALLQHPLLGLPLLAVAALALRITLSTGTAVELNPATLLVPVLMAVWAIDGLRRRELHVVPSRVNRPLLAFLLCGLLSLGIGTVLWDPLVPHASNLILVQLAQWAIFAFAAGAFWLPVNLRADERALRRLVFFFLAVAGTIALLRVLLGSNRVFEQFSTGAVDRAPFWVLLAALAGGQLLYNRELSPGWRLLLVAILAADLYYVGVLQREVVSHWIGVAAVAGILGWLRFPRLRWLAVPLLAILLLTGTLYRALFLFAGGEQEWVVSGGSRVALISRVVEVTMRNPITGLGPAAYRAYAGMKPLAYGNALWVNPEVNSHNNYVDLFAHVGLLGTGLFLWFMVELLGLGWRLHVAGRKSGFLAGFVDSMLATWGGVMVIMLLADWMLPHVYNIGFHGFQASLPVWMFLGGLLVVERLYTNGLAETQDRLR